MVNKQKFRESILFLMGRKDVMTVTKISRILDVSTSPIRDAMNSMAKDGLLSKTKLNNGRVIWGINK
jgi:DNA-binding GntR family transcriptional regulator